MVVMPCEPGAEVVPGVVIIAGGVVAVVVPGAIIGAGVLGIVEDPGVTAWPVRGGIGFAVPGVPELPGAFIMPGAVVGGVLEDWLNAGAIRSGRAIPANRKRRMLGILLRGA